MDVKKTIDVRGKSVQERQQTAKKESMTLRPGEVIEIIADDERMPAVAPKMAQDYEMFEGVEPAEESAGMPVIAIVVVLIFFGLIVSAPLLTRRK